MESISFHKECLPDAVVDGETLPRQGMKMPGILFFNDEGVECGGLIFGGRTGEDGKPQVGTSLTVDRFKQDQVLALQHIEGGSSHGATGPSSGWRSAPHPAGCERKTAATPRCCRLPAGPDYLLTRPFP